MPVLRFNNNGKEHDQKVITFGDLSIFGAKLDEKGNLSKADQILKATKLPLIKLFVKNEETVDGRDENFLCPCYQMDCTDKPNDPIFYISCRANNADVASFEEIGVYLMFPKNEF